MGKRAVGISKFLSLVLRHRPETLGIKLDELGYQMAAPPDILYHGTGATVSDDKDNVHWFKATSDVAFTFNIGVYGIEQAVKFSGRQFYLDPSGGEKLGDGTLRVRHLTSEEAHKLYGKS